jgi:hypothetical protein
VFVSDNGGYIGNFDNVPVTSNFPLRSERIALQAASGSSSFVGRARGGQGICREPVYIADLFRRCWKSPGTTDLKASLMGNLMPLLKIQQS